MFILPDLAKFPDYQNEPHNLIDEVGPDQMGDMISALRSNNFEKFVERLHLEDVEWVRRLKHFFNFYHSWGQRNYYSVEELYDGLYVLSEDVDYLKQMVQPDINELMAKPDWTPPPGTFDRGKQLPHMCEEIYQLFDRLGIIQIASKYNKRPMKVANVFLHIAKPTDTNWKQFFMDAKTTPKYTNTHIDPKEDVIKAMIYLNDVTVDNGAFHYYKGSNRKEVHPVQNIFGRAISTGSYCHTPESRSSVFKLPDKLRVSHNFGRQVLPGSAWEKLLDENLKPVTSEQGNIMVFDPGAGIHQGGICKSGTRLALQILMK